MIANDNITDEEILQGPDVPAFHLSIGTSDSPKPDGVYGYVSEAITNGAAFDPDIDNFLIFPDLIYWGGDRDY